MSLDVRICACQVFTLFDPPLEAGLDKPALGLLTRGFSEFQTPSIFSD